MRRAIIVDAPDLPPDECEFYITAYGVADTQEVKVNEKVSLKKISVEKITIEEDFFEEDTNGQSYNLIDVKGIGAGTEKQLKKQGIKSISDLLASNPEVIAKKISGISENKINEWQTNAKALLSA